MTSRLVGKLNDALDRRVRWGIPWRGREVSGFRFWATAGLTVSIAVAMTLSVVRALDPLLMLAVIAAGGAACFLLALGYKVITGEEQLVFLHHVTATMASAAVGLHLVGEPATPYLEILAVSFGLLLALGRLGCLSAGCCHGRPHDWGVRYGPQQVDEGFPSALIGVRLAPVQLAESVWAGVASIAAVGALATDAPAGATLSWFVPTYALARFVCELWRGDAARTWWGPLSEAQWVCLGLTAGVVAAQWTDVLPAGAWSRGFALVVLAGQALVAASGPLRRRLEPFRPDDVEAVAEAIRADGDGSVVVRTLRSGWRLSRGRISSNEGACLHWAVSGMPSGEGPPDNLTDLLLRMEGLPRDTPVRIDDTRQVTHILAFPSPPKETLHDG